MTRHLWWVQLAVCAALAAVTALAPGSALADVTYLVGLTSIVASLWWAVLVSREARGPWRLLALAASCWLAGDTVQRILGAFGTGSDAVGPPDALWLASYPLLVGAVLLVLRGRGLPRSVLREISLDGVVVAAAAATGTWRLLIEPALADGSAPLATTVHVLYPLGDVAIFTVGLTLLMAQERVSTVNVLVLGCVGLTLPLDLLAAALPIVAPTMNLDGLDAAYLVVNAFLGAAALHPDRGVLIAPATAGHRLQGWRVVLLGISLTAICVASVAPGASLASALLSVAAAVVVSTAILLRFYRAVRQQERAYLEVRRLADHDVLTGVANRAVLMQHLCRPPAPGRDTLVFVDLDGFKAVNDRHGHHAGDRILLAVAQRLATLAQDGGLLARVGGDEFVLLRGTADGEDARRLGERVVDLVSQAVEVDGVPLRVGASVGVARAPRPDDARGPVPRPRGDLLHAAEEWLRIADAAMYEAKRSGGGRPGVRVAHVPHVPHSPHVPGAAPTPGPVAAQ